MRCKPNCATAIALAMVAGILAGARPAAAQTDFRLGVFFDTGAQSCVGEIRNFAPPQRAYVYALVPAGTVVNGALLRLVLPHGLVVDAVQPPHSLALLDGTLTGPTGLEITLQDCLPARGPVLLLRFDFHQFDDEVDPGGMVPDMLLQLKGGATGDSLTFEKPQVKVAGEDCVGGTPQLVESIALQSTLNCTADCPCTTAVQRATWADVKRRFLRP